MNSLGIANSHQDQRIVGPKSSGMELSMAHIEKLLEPYLGTAIDQGRKQEILHAVLEKSFTNYSKAGQCLEIPGAALQGIAFWAPNSYAYAYHYAELSGKFTRTITQLWVSGMPIFNPESLLKGEDRLDYIAMFAESEYLYMSYRDVNALMKQFPEIDEVVRKFVELSQNATLTFLSISRLPIASRIDLFHETYPEIFKMCSMEIRAELLGISRHTYSKYLSKKK